MSATCCAPNVDRNNPPAWRKTLWAALAINAGMFLLEIYAGATADSRALLADAMDFFGDAANYAISLVVAGMSITWRARATLVKGATLVLLGGFVLAAAVFAAIGGSSPGPQTMGIIGTLALLANVAVAAMLFGFRAGDANMRSVWICSRNDAIGNVAVVAAAVGVFGTGTAWPDLLVASILASLGFWGGTQIVLQARGELKSAGGRPALR